MSRALTTLAALSALCAMTACDGPAMCGAPGDCAADEICINGACLTRGSCEGVSCASGETCMGGVCLGPDAEPERIDAGRDAGRDAGSDAGIDSGLVRRDATIERNDTGPDALDAGDTADAGADAGCTCTPDQVITTVNCGVCGRAEVRCDRDCRSTSQTACVGADVRCTDPLAPHCRNDYCWGMFATHELGMGDMCVDMAADYVPSDGVGAGVYGTLDIEVRGRPGASWVRENRYTSCGASSPWIAAEFGTLDASGRDDSPPFEYGPSDCDLDTLGRHDSRVIFTDPGLLDITLPSNPTRLYNSDCTADRNSCADTETYCSAS